MSAGPSDRDTRDGRAPASGIRLASAAMDGRTTTPGASAAPIPSPAAPRGTGLRAAAAATLGEESDAAVADDLLRELVAHQDAEIVEALASRGVDIEL